MSMPVSAIRAHVRSTAQAAGAPKPKCQAAHADKMPVVTSTAGYRAEILVLQDAQRPRSISQLKTGMFCQGLMGALQFGQAEPGVIKLKRGGAGVDSVAGAAPASTSAAWERQSRSSMMGNR